MPTTTKFAGRAAAALALMVGFYALALGLIAALGALVWVDVHQRRIHPKLVLFAAVAIFAIAKGLLFLADTFEPPGPEVTKQQEPQLFALIEEVAKTLGTRPPDHVYLFAAPNAFVTEVGGFLGIFGTRRVMGLGLAKIGQDSVAMLKATIAHEFGHFLGGETKLGGFIYRTRASIGRVVESLGEDAWLSWPFKQYAKLYLRVTRAISRQQELDADTVAVKVAGRAARVESLRRVAIAGTVYQRFIETEVLPLLDSDVAPRNLFEGLRLYLANLGEDGRVADLEDALHAVSTDPLDTHPSLADRIAHAKALPDPRPLTDDRPARELFKDPDAIEQEFTRGMFKAPGEGGPKQLVDWQDVGATVYAIKAARLAKPLESLENGSGFGKLLRELETRESVDLVREVAPDALDNVDEPSPAAAKRMLSMMYASRLAVELAALPGSTWDAAPGRPVRVTLANGATIDPADEIIPYVEEHSQVPILRERLKMLGLAQVD